MLFQIHIFKKILEYCNDIDYIHHKRKNKYILNEFKCFYKKYYFNGLYYHNIYIRPGICINFIESYYIDCWSNLSKEFIKKHWNNNEEWIYTYYR